MTGPPIKTITLLPCVTIQIETKLSRNEQPYLNIFKGLQLTDPYVLRAIKRGADRSLTTPCHVVSSFGKVRFSRCIFLHLQLDLFAGNKIFLRRWDSSHKFVWGKRGSFFFPYCTLYSHAGGVFPERFPARIRKIVFRKGKFGLVLIDLFSVFYFCFDAGIYFIAGFSGDSKVGRKTREIPTQL